MKIEKAVLPLITAVALALGLAGCSKNEPTTSAADDANKGAGSSADTVAKAAEDAKVEAAKADAAAKAEAANATDGAKTHGFIDKAKSLIAEGQYSDAIRVLQQLTGKSLSSDQQKLVDGLKERIQEALVAKAVENAAGDAGDLLNQ